jgi:hypothetical protein
MVLKVDRNHTPFQMVISGYLINGSALQRKLVRNSVDFYEDINEEPSLF